MAAVTAPSDVARPGAGGPRGHPRSPPPAAERSSAPWSSSCSAAFFLLPLRDGRLTRSAARVPGTHSLTAWTQIVDYQTLLERDRDHAGARRDHAAVVMLVLLVPTMIWVQLRVPWLSPCIEFLCLLPLTVPAIVLVVGLAPIYRQIRITTASPR